MNTHAAVRASAATRFPPATAASRPARFVIGVLVLLGFITATSLPRDALALGDDIINCACGRTSTGLSTVFGVGSNFDGGTIETRFTVRNCRNEAGFFDADLWVRFPGGTTGTAENILMEGFPNNNFRSVDPFNLNLSGGGSLPANISSSSVVRGSSVRIDMSLGSGSLDYTGRFRKSRLFSSRAPASVIAPLLLLGAAHYFAFNVENQVTYALFGPSGISGPTPAVRLADNVSVVPISGGMRMQGQAAGGGFSRPWAVWGSVQYDDFENDFVATAFDADRKGITLGADFLPVDNVVIGLAASYSQTDVTTSFNNGGAEVDAFMLAPYIGILLNEQLGVDTEISIDAAAGYSTVEYDQYRTDAGARITSNPAASRWFFSTNLNASEAVTEQLRLTGTLGLLFSSEQTEGFTESNGTAVQALNTRTGRWTVGVDAAYAWGPAVPFVSLFYEKEFESEELVAAGANQPSNDDDQFRLGFGARFYGDEGMSGNVEFMKTLGRDNYDDLGVTATLRAEF